MPGNDVLQVHRYLDLGASWKICGSSVAELTADAVKFLLSLKIQKPVLLAESGAVEPNHSGPFKLYEKDKEGIIFHDVLFAPFFVGAAGSGQCWHWDSYVAKNDIWFHIGRFANVVEEINPVEEQFEPFEIEHPRVYLYGLKGKTKTMVWCRDKENTWRSELEEGKKPETLTGIEFDSSAAGNTAKMNPVKVYDPWEDKWKDGSNTQTKIAVPPFQRSAVLVINRS
ncbi:hypothetical protein FACS189427_01850 [Planctomycetales bacterium]|nr:hypothetical protein FACS189427_01850 [Planctomycetales bacterium]